MHHTNSISLKEAQDLYSSTAPKYKRVRIKSERPDGRISKKRFCVPCLSNSCEHVKEAKTITLTPRDILVLRALASGMFNKEIASHLGKTEGTIKTCISIISVKIRVSGRVNLAIWYMKNRELLEAVLQSEIH